MLKRLSRMCSRIMESGDNVQKLCDIWPIGRPFADMLQSDYPIRIDQHITTTLIDISVRFFRLIAFGQLPEIDQPRSETPHIPERGRQHPETFVNFTRVIDQDRPRKRGILNITTGKIVILKRDHHNFDIQPDKFVLLITQLRDVRPAGQSPQVPVEYHQEPAAAKILTLVNTTRAVM